MIVGDRFLAHRILHQGHEHKLSVLSICRNGEVYRIHITPFAGEEHSTSFHSGTIAVCCRDCTPDEALESQNFYKESTEPPHLVFF